MRALQQLVKDEGPDVVFLKETKKKASEMEGIRKRIKFYSMVASDCGCPGW